MPKTLHQELSRKVDLSNSVIIYTDGGAHPNPGRGGYGAVLLYKGKRKELSGGYSLTTNNRMEILAAIRALEVLKRRCSVMLYSDSKYIVNAINKGWARRWRRNNWMRTKEEAAKNSDLWSQLLELCEQHEVNFQWVRGHAASKENNRCDTLATRARLKSALPADEGYLAEIEC